PTATPEPVVEPTEAPTEPPTTSGEEIISIDQVHGFYDIYDSLNVIGLVTNNTSRAIDNVEIEVEIFDANDESLFVDTLFVDLFALAPGETSPFSMLIFDDLPDADNFAATVVGNSVTDVERATLDISNSLMTVDDDGNIHITGELFNNTDQPVDITALAAAVFDANGEIVASDSYNTTIRYLDPGDSGPFRVTITGPDSGTADITNFQVYIDSEFTDPIAPFNIAIGDAYNYLDTFDNFHLVGQVTNNSDTTWNVRMVAGIYDAEGNVLDAAYVDLPINALAPGTSSPYDFDFWGPLASTSDLFDQGDSYSIQVDAYWTWENATELIDLTTANDAKEFGSFGGTFTGQVVNNSGGPVDSVVVVIYMTDNETGEIVATGDTYLFDEIADGSSVDYTVYIDPEEGFDINSAQYFIIVKAERLQ
ncbi:MAG TPA: FxLYD domain-containing protein, partial [Anaerolineales bacterium]|nr:FxLYD domain-containing protein [Anaerolineales bacterium]